jgi:hypothetical protein
VEHGMKESSGKGLGISLHKKAKERLYENDVENIIIIITLFCIFFIYTYITLQY